MQLFKLTRQSKILIVILLIFSSICFGIAYVYYSSKNKTEDPRVLETKFMLQRFDKLLAENKFTESLSLLDSIEPVFKNTCGYSDSYELGIVYNNRASVYLSKALYQETDSLEKQTNLSFAKANIDSCISIYIKWLEKNKDLSTKELLEKNSQFFQESDIAFQGKNIQKILQKRVEDLVLAQNETPRRLSVAYTNLGTIQRHQYCQPEAIESFIKAISLWKDNYTARNNFNVLMGKEPEDRSIIEQLFPPEKNKFN